MPRPTQRPAQPGVLARTPLFLLALAARRRDFVPDARRTLNFLHSRRALPALGTLAVVELVYDKLPFVPSRLHPLSLALRLTTGTLAGAAITHEVGAPVGGTVGAGAAIAGSVAGYHFRGFLARNLGLPGVAAVVEDVTALSLGALVTWSRHSDRSTIVRLFVKR